MATFRTFDEYGRENPCSGCPAPCCRAQVHNYSAPEKFMDLDQARYRLLSPAAELLLARDGDWLLVQWIQCTLFEEGTCACSVHGTPAKPKVCVQFNPYDCWFRQNFSEEPNQDAVRFNLARYAKWTEQLQIDEEGKIVALPTFESAQALVADIPIEPAFQKMPVAAGAAVRPLERKEA